MCKGTLPASGSIRQSPEQFHTRTGVKFRSKSQWSYVVSQAITGRKSFTQNWRKVSQRKPMVSSIQSGNNRTSFTAELVQSVAGKANGRIQSVQNLDLWLLGRKAKDPSELFTDWSSNISDFRDCVKVCKKIVIDDFKPALLLTDDHERFVAAESIPILLTTSSKVLNSVAQLLFSINY